MRNSCISSARSQNLSIARHNTSISMFYYSPYTDYLGFHEDGVIYNGYISSGKIQVLDLKINQKYLSSAPSSYLMKPDNSTAAATGSDVLLTTDGEYIYKFEL